MSFFGNGSVGHGSCLKSCYDGIYVFHFFDRNALLRIIKFKLASQVDLFALFIHHLCVLFEQIITSGSCRLLKHVDRLWIVKMFFSTALIFMLSDAVQCHIYSKSQRIKGLCMECSIIFCNLLNSDSTDTADCIGKITIDKVTLQTDRLKDLCSLIRLDR